MHSSTRHMDISIYHRDQYRMRMIQECIAQCIQSFIVCQLISCMIDIDSFGFQNMYHIQSDKEYMCNCQSIGIQARINLTQQCNFKSLRMPCIVCQRYMMHISMDTYNIDLKQSLNRIQTNNLIGIPHSALLCC